MEGMILAAGLGTRLRPLTDSRPKALVEVCGRTLLELCIGRMAEAGIRRVVVNVHHFGDMMIDYIGSRRWPCEVAVSDERPLLLDTGGALRHAAPLFSGREDVLVHNVDILSEVDFHDLEACHRSAGNLATLCVSRRTTRRMLRFSAEGQLERRAEGCEADERTLAFSGITLVSPELFGLLPEVDHPYPIIDEYLRLVGQGYRIGSYRHPAEHWLDVGKPETLEKASLWYRS